MDQSTKKIYQKALGMKLCRVANNKDKNKRYVKWHNATTLKAQNFVGVVTTKDGTQIEIFPKIYNKKDLITEKDLEISRKNACKNADNSA